MESRCRHCGDVGLGLAHTLPFIVCKEEKPVLPAEQVRNGDRPTYIRAKLIHVKGWNRIRMRVKVVLGVKVRVTHKLIESAMKIVGTGAKRNIDDRWAAAIRS